MKLRQLRHTSKTRNRPASFPLLSQPSPIGCSDVRQVADLASREPREGLGSVGRPTADRRGRRPTRAAHRRSEAPLPKRPVDFLNGRGQELESLKLALTDALIEEGNSFACLRSRFAESLLGLRDTRLSHRRHSHLAFPWARCSSIALEVRRNRSTRSSSSRSASRMLFLKASTEPACLVSGSVGASGV
jgi:hypothetical protein